MIGAGQGVTAKRRAFLVATAQALGYTEAQWRALGALRDHYRLYGDWYSPREVQRLRFTRWLVATGRLGR